MTQESAGGGALESSRALRIELMEGAHKGARRVGSTVVVGCRSTAAAQRQQSQDGVAAQGRKGKRSAVGMQQAASKKDAAAARSKV